MKRKRSCDESAVGIGAMIVFIASVLLACIILFSMIQMTERLVQTPEETLFDSTREIADKIIVREMYVWDEYDNYGILWELSPGSEPKQPEDLYWILQCTDPNDKFWSFWGDFTTVNLQEFTGHEFLNSKDKTNTGLKAEFFDNQGMGFTSLPDLTNRLPDHVEAGMNVNYGNGGGAWASTLGGNIPYTDEYSLRMTGYLNIPTSGTYGFELSSDDGSKLWVDGTLVIDHDGTHAFSAQAGQIDLTSGQTSIQIEYFENTGVQGLELRWQQPGQAWDIVQIGHLDHDDNQYDANNNDDFLQVNTYMPGILYEIAIDQNNGDSGINDPNAPLPAETCGPTQLHQNGLYGHFYFIVGGGGATSHESFTVPHATAGSRLV